MFELNGSGGKKSIWQRTWGGGVSKILMYGRGGVERKGEEKLRTD